MKILLPVDGSEVALEAVREALRLLHGGLRASFVLANVQEPATLYEIVRAHDAQVIEHVSDAAGRHALEVAQQMLRAGGAEFDSEIGSGDPGHTLVEIAEAFDCDMVIISARGVGMTGSAVLGSVANSVLHAAQMPVLVVKQPEG